jgi:hypothetical protein
MQDSELFKCQKLLTQFDTCTWYYPPATYISILPSTAILKLLFLQPSHYTCLFLVKEVWKSLWWNIRNSNIILYILTIYLTKVKSFKTWRRTISVSTCHAMTRNITVSRIVQPHGSCRARSCVETFRLGEILVKKLTEVASYTTISFTPTSAAFLLGLFLDHKYGRILSSKMLTLLRNTYP